MEYKNDHKSLAQGSTPTFPITNDSLFLCGICTHIYYIIIVFIILI